MESVKKVSVVLDMHPEDYRRMREAADNAEMPEGEFCGLALHRGIGLMCDFRRDLRLPPRDPERNGMALEAKCER
ncbi:hypothetical protein [Burkholderia ubonensis]|uniref:hypothetical protein n=1 Tax=Burkholderia ubonensis TaxID=101571 RepID=UPI000753337F|nr:hypothetical protein [Burkholderia ubonensis]KVO15118.1 hypothetical protein WJ74_10715 [Burkholderia ubonensis]KVT01157.1 hypothetical protein WK47_25115 [Burkholderia ubonensis]KVT33813.1 hypothetical protein WK50_02495 [Burkholderia ubonensis]